MSCSVLTLIRAAKQADMDGAFICLMTVTVDPFHPILNLLVHLLAAQQSPFGQTVVWSHFSRGILPKMGSMALLKIVIPAVCLGHACPLLTGVILVALGLWAVRLHPRKTLDMSWLDLLASFKACFTRRDRQSVEKQLQQILSPEEIVTLSVRSAFDLLLSALDLPRGSEAGPSVFRRHKTGVTNTGRYQWFFVLFTHRCTDPIDAEHRVFSAPFGQPFHFWNSGELAGPNWLFGSTHLPVWHPCPFPSPAARCCLCPASPFRPWFSSWSCTVYSRWAWTLCRLSKCCQVNWSPL